MLPADAGNSTWQLQAPMLYIGYAVTKLRVKIDAIPGRLNQFESESRSPVHIMDNAQNYVELATVLCQ